MDEFSVIFRPLRRVRASGAPIVVIERCEAANWANPYDSGTDYVFTLESAYDTRTGERVA